jgi:hypothetical protein
VLPVFAVFPAPKSPPPAAGWPKEGVAAAGAPNAGAAGAAEPNPPPIEQRCACFHEPRGAQHGQWEAP